MENGGLADKFGGLTMNDAKDTSLFQVMKAVEAAEATIKQQVEENYRLRAELQRKEQELEQTKMDRKIAHRYPSVEPYDEHVRKSEVPAKELHIESHSGISRNNGSLNALPHEQMITERSTTSVSPLRYPMDGGYGGFGGQGVMHVDDSNKASNIWKQDLLLKISDHEQEIMHLKRHLTHYSVREAQIRNETYVLEKRIAQMRMAFDQQQQDIVDASSKALSYRQDIIEENVRLSYALQDAQQEQTIYVSSLLPLLSEYSLQPQVLDAQSVISSVKVLFKHLQEKLIITEAKLKDSQYQLTPWRPDGNNSNFYSPSPQNLSGAAPTSSNNGLQLVAERTYPSPSAANFDAPMGTDWDIGGDQGQQTGLGGPLVKSTELDGIGRHSPMGNRNSTYNEEAINPQEVKCKDLVSSSEMDESDAEGPHDERHHPGDWVLGTSPYAETIDEPPVYSPYLQAVPEEPSSSFSEAADDDALPGIQDLQISGEACPGHELQACGYSVNGTTSCNFEWVRHLEDGSVNYIDGAKQPIYIVNADDVDTYLAIEVQPLDDRKRKGELVRVFANEHRKISCDPGMRDLIEKNLYNGHASYTVFFSIGYLDKWEPASLSIKREGYTIKCSGPNSVSVAEKFSSGTSVIVAYGHPSELSIITPEGIQHLLRAENTIPDTASSTEVCRVSTAAMDGRCRRCATTVSLSLLIFLVISNVSLGIRVADQISDLTAKERQLTNQPLKTAVFALGSFWRSESVFGCLNGVVRTTVGYSGGTRPNPEYRRLGNHAECVQVDYDPRVITYRQLLEVFWSSHDSRQVFGQGPDVGNQYRSIIFTNGTDELRLATMSKEREQTKSKNTIVITQIQQLETFYPAESEHQKFELKRNPILLHLIGNLPAEELERSNLAAKLNSYAAELCPPRIQKLIDSKIKEIMKRGWPVLTEI